MRHGGAREFALRRHSTVSVEFNHTASVDHEVQLQHYAFLISEDEFDQVFRRVQEAGLTYYADPHGERPGEINRNDGGRGMYFIDPAGHGMEVITRPYGSGS
ncbi:hypothetical protein AB0903_21355 [Streptomyces sp. NPDC048389]|uniref:hypothetical protein n=1 Tax=Streptomyces sp. NPDC048389 TaxID=3154622 RepID=UPI003456E719